MNVSYSQNLQKNEHSLHYALTLKGRLQGIRIHLNKLREHSFGAPWMSPAILAIKYVAVYTETYRSSQKNLSTIQNAIQEIYATDL